MADPKLDKSAERSRDIAFTSPESPRLWEAYSLGFRDSTTDRDWNNIYQSGSTLSDAYEEGWRDGRTLRATGKDS